jgi:hypothetical protein
VTVPGPVPLATEAQVRRLVQQWLRKPGNGRVLAVQARPQWTAAATLEVGGRTVRVVPCPSPLAMRAALVDAAPDERLVVLTDCDADALGTGLLAHCARLKVFSIEPWDLVRSEFNVTDLDPALVREGHWLAEALTEQAPPNGWPPVTGTVQRLRHGDRCPGPDGGAGRRRPAERVARVLGRAEEIARAIHAEKLLVRSDLLPAALTARLHVFADAVRAALTDPSPPTVGAVEVALRGLRRHRLATVGGRVGLAEMAVRLLRWLATPEAPAPATLAAAARRAAHDEQFAVLLAQNTTADSAPGSMLRIEDVRDRVVRPVLDAGRPVLLLVVDGMSVAASTELVASATEAGWIELTPVAARGWACWPRCPPSRR